MRRVVGVWSVLTLVACLLPELAWGQAPPPPPPPPPVWCDALTVSKAQTSWPDVFVASGELFQQNCGQPGCVNVADGLGYCTAAGSIQYDWTAKAMLTEYMPCLPLVTPVGGSPQVCTYHFIGGDLYYVYQNQPMIVGQPPTSSPQCCKISDFPMLSPSFPLFTEQYNQKCEGTKPEMVRMYGQKMRWLHTPGNPPGFYGYYPEVTQPPGAGADSWATPYGFGGGTPGGFTQISYQHFAPNPTEMPSFDIPSLCENAPECTMPNLALSPPPSYCPGHTDFIEVALEPVITISTFLRCLAPVRAGGCALCHTTTETGPTFQGEMPCCPNQVWTEEKGCVEAPPGCSPPLLYSCLRAATAKTETASTAPAGTAPSPVASH